ncbi:HAD family hydrolase [Patescibacteria group bacterium]|nr:HAD family hydrolase [Patescibacteria group bacterium]
MIKLIIFDWDDVFTLGSKEGYFKCYHETITQLGIHLDSEEEKRRILSQWGKTHREGLTELLKEHPEFIDRACKIYEDILFGNTFVDCLSIVPGSRELLNKLQRNYTLALATGVHPKLLKERIIPKFDIPDVFTKIVTSYDIDDPSKLKPHPFMLETIMKSQNTLPNETVLVGDAQSDVQMAKNAGITPIVVLTGHLNQEEAQNLGVKHIIKNVTHLEEILHKLKK